MKCPHCDDELIIGDIPECHMERYGKTVKVATKCCGRPVICTPFLSYYVRIDTYPEESDDWGTPYKREG